MSREPQQEPIRLTRAQVREVDRLAVERYHMPSILLMENAAQAVAYQAGRLIADEVYLNVLVLCGGGNNGGDGLAIARLLSNLNGVSVQIGLTIDASKYSGDALINWRIVKAMNLPVHGATPESIRACGHALIVDAIFGTGLTQPPREPFGALVDAIAETENAVLAVDVPSGLDCDTGEPLGPCIRATRTVTFVAEKTGFANPSSRQYTGEVVVADIGCPRGLIQQVMSK